MKQGAIMGCENVATKTASRPTAEEERYIEITDIGLKIGNTDETLYVCDEHLENIRHEYPYIADVA